jgi:putative sigma-54 modulation protein
MIFIYERAAWIGAFVFASEPLSSPASFLSAMQIHITPRHLRLTAALHQAVAAQISSIEDLGIDIIGAHIVLLHDDVAKPSDRFLVKAHLAIPGPDIFAEQTGADIYIALEQVASKLARQLRKRKTELTDKPRSKEQRAEETSKREGTPRKTR